LAQHAGAVLDPRKSPVQARSAATVDAILKATIQVLLKVCKERLTTTFVATRAGVLVGTLYQYFPNKSALLKAALKEHMTQVAESIKRIGREQHGQPLEERVAALMSAFLEAKMRDMKTSLALYSVSSDVDGAQVVQEMTARVNRAIVTMLESAPEAPADVELVASVLHGAMAGVSRRLLESKEPEKQFEAMRAELVFLARAYVRARM
jgi:AcrR family transcriptional regulator